MSYAWTADDYRAIAELAVQLGMKPADLLAVLDAESGLDPAAKNPAGAYGLNQLTRAAGFSQVELEHVVTLTPAGQAAYIGRYFQGVGAKAYADAGDVYGANFAPGVVRGHVPGAADSLVLYARTASDVIAAGGACKGAYGCNAGLDLDHDGKITMGDLRRRLASVVKGTRYQNALAELKAAVPGSGDPKVIEPPTPSLPATLPPPASPPSNSTATTDSGGGTTAMLSAMGIVGLLGWRLLRRP